LIALQIDALAYAELRRAIELGYCPEITKMVREEDYVLRRWFCGLPSATPYCQAGIFHGENDGIPAFRFYDKASRFVVTCNSPRGVQYIRDRIHTPGALAGGSSYVNLLDGDAQTVAFTVATRRRMSVYRRLGGTRMALLIALHPIRAVIIVVYSVLEWLREEWERTVGELSRQRTHSEGLFPFIRILSNVVVRELQTMAILLDVYLGVPVIYSTYMQYDELGHHFGPGSWQALRDLRRTDSRIRSIRRMIRSAAGREYDLVILSDHGMTPSASYRVRYGESLGSTVQRILDGDAARRGRVGLSAHTSENRIGEYAEVGANLIESLALETPPRRRAIRRMFRRMGSWMRRHYGVRELILPEKYRVDERHDVVVTYSSSLALVYFADVPERLGYDAIAGDRRRAQLYAELLAHPGIGLIGTLDGYGVRVEGAKGWARIHDGAIVDVFGNNPLEPYGTEPVLARAVERLVKQTNAGDLVLFGTYDGYEIVCFDDQIGAHGSAGGSQLYPFLIAPRSLGLESAVLEDARDLHGALMSKYATVSA
jgi:hypothetical protein